jgi:cytoskeletal protein CcmA (bactofilin family)
MILTFGIFSIISVLTIVGVLLYSFYSIDTVKTDINTLATEAAVKFQDVDVNANTLKDIIDKTHTEQMDKMKTDIDKSHSVEYSKAAADLDVAQKKLLDDTKTDYTSQFETINTKVYKGLTDTNKKYSDLNTKVDSGLSDTNKKFTDLNTSTDVRFTDTNNKINTLDSKVDANSTDTNTKFASVNTAFNTMSTNFTNFTTVTYPADKAKLKTDVIASISNVTGAKGDTGATGATGIQGVKGDTGPKGDSSAPAMDYTKSYDFALGSSMGGASDPKGDTGMSRTLTKDNGQVLAINYNNDFKGGVRVDSKMSVKGDFDVTGNVSSSSLLISSKLSTADATITGTLSGAGVDKVKADIVASIPKVNNDYEAYSDAIRASASSQSPNGWNVGGDSSWDPNFRGNRVGYAYNNEQNEEDATASWIAYSVPTGMKQGYLIYLAWNNCRYFDIWGINSSGNEVYIRRVNAYQGISSNFPQNMYDGVSAASIAGVNRFKQIKIRGVKGRINIMGIGWTSEEGRGMDNGFVHYDNIIQGSSMTTPANIVTSGRMNLSGGESLYILNKNGVVVSKNSGGTGNLTVDGDTNIAGSLKVTNVDISGTLSGAALSKLSTSGLPGATGATGSTGPAGIGITDISAVNTTMTIKTSDGKTYTVTLPIGSTGGKGSDGVSITNITASGSTLTIKLSDNTTQTVTLPAAQQGIQGVKGDTGPSGASAGGSSSLTLNNNGTGIVWGNNYSKIYDDGNLHINTDDAMYISAPANLDVTTPNLNISGSTKVNKLCIGATCVTEDNLKALLTSQSVSQTLKDIATSTILGSKHYTAISTLLPNVGFTLLYRGSRDGFASSVFHTKCDNQGSTFLVFKSDGGYIATAYVNISWDVSNNYKTATSGTCWLNNLENPSGTISTTKALNSAAPQYTIYCNNSYGPTFGGGHDLMTVSTINASGGYTNPHSYSGFTNATLFGSYSAWKITEIEVYKVA